MDSSLISDFKFNLLFCSFAVFAGLVFCSFAVFAGLVFCSFAVFAGLVFFSFVVLLFLQVWCLCRRGWDD